MRRILANGKLGRAKEPFTANADQFGSDIAAVVADVPAAGAVSLCAIATELTARRIKTRRGGRCQMSNVKEVLARQVSSSTEAKAKK